MIIMGSPVINFLCFVLCLITSIVMYSEIAPPKNASKNSAFSEMRFFLKTALLLSEKVIIAVIIEMMIIYIIK